jgi:hypothetical protein
MSVNTIITNPTILEELRLAINSGSNTGGAISELRNADGNLNVSVSGFTGNINLQPNISVDGLNIKQQISLNGNPGSSGQVLTSGGSGIPSWTTPQGGGSGGMLVLYQSYLQSPAVSNSTITLFNTGQLTNTTNKPLIVSGLVVFFAPQGSGYYPFEITILENTSIIAQTSSQIGGGYTEYYIPLNLSFTPTVANATYTVQISSTGGLLTQSSANPNTGNIQPCFQSIVFMQ